MSPPLRRFATHPLLPAREPTPEQRARRERLRDPRTAAAVVEDYNRRGKLTDAAEAVDITREQARIVLNEWHQRLDEQVSAAMRKTRAPAAIESAPSRHAPGTATEMTT